MIRSVTKQTLQRLPLYLNYLKSLPQNGPCNISSTMIAEALKLGEVQVRKDLSVVSSGGKPKIGYITKDLIFDIEHFLGCDNAFDSVLIGAGHLGCALLSYEGFKDFGLNIVAAFDINESVINTEYYGKPIFPIEKLSNLCSRLNIHIGIITVPANQAQNICNLLIKNGIKAIWNFAPTHLTVPENILVQNENMASSFALLSNHLFEQLNNS